MYRMCAPGQPGIIRASHQTDAERRSLFFSFSTVCVCLIWICTLTGWWDRLVGFKQNIGFMAQGEQRVLDKAGRVYPFKDPSQHVLVRTDTLPPCTPRKGYNPHLVVTL